jgi:hypothetical protein
VAILLLGCLASYGARAHPLKVAVKFVHRDTYPNAVVLVWVTNSGVRPVFLGTAKVYFRSDGGSDSLDWSGWDLPSDWPLRPGAIASFSLPTWEGEAQGRLTFKYTYEAPLRRAISPVIRVGAQLFGLKPVGNPDSHNTWWWLANHGLLDGHVHPIYDGPWVRWEKMSGSK